MQAHWDCDGVTESCRGQSILGLRSLSPRIQCPAVTESFDTVLWFPYFSVFHLPQYMYFDLNIVHSFEKLVSNTFLPPSLTTCKVIPFVGIITVYLIWIKPGIFLFNSTLISSFFSPKNSRDICIYIVCCAWLIVFLNNIVDTESVTLLSKMIFHCT